MAVLWAVVVIAQTTITTVEDYAKVMKSTSQAMGALDKSLAADGLAEAKQQLSTVRQNFMALQAFWTAKKRDDAIGIVKDALTKIDALDKMLGSPAEDAKTAQAAAKEIRGSCGACHKLYREGDAKTGFSFKPGVM
jgi:hypothetical protein